MGAAKGSVPHNKGKRAPKRQLTGEMLRTQFHYDPETGVFTRLDCHPMAKPGPVSKTTPKGYVRVHVLGKQVMAHRLAWFWVHGVWPTQQIDHINGHRDDNRIANLRDATPSENRRNRHAPESRGYKLNLSAQERARRAEWMRTVRRAAIAKAKCLLVLITGQGDELETLQ